MTTVLNPIPITITEVLRRLPLMERPDPNDMKAFQTSDRWATYTVGIDSSSFGGRMWIEVKPFTGKVAIRMFSEPNFVLIGISAEDGYRSLHTSAKG